MSCEQCRYNFKQGLRIIKKVSMIERYCVKKRTSLFNLTSKICSSFKTVPSSNN